MRFLIIFCIVTSYSFSFDIVNIGKKGQSYMLYSQNGEVIYRKCAKYSIVETRKDCKAEKEFSLGNLAKTKQSLLESSVAYVSSGKAQAESLKEGPLTPSFPKPDMKKKLSVEARKSKLAQIKVMDDYKEKFGEDAIEKSEYDSLQEDLSLDQKALSYSQKVYQEKERLKEILEPIMTLIGNDKKLESDYDSLNPDAKELLTRFISNIGASIKAGGTSSFFNGKRHNCNVVDQDKDNTNPYVILNMASGSRSKRNCYKPGSSKRRSDPLGPACEKLLEDAIRTGFCHLLLEKVVERVVNTTEDLAISNAQRQKTKDTPGTSTGTTTGTSVEKD